MSQIKTLNMLAGSEQKLLIGGEILKIFDITLNNSLIDE